jgi:hypothetical protein
LLATPDKETVRSRGLSKPTIANWGDAKLSDYAVDCCIKMNAPKAHLPDRVCVPGRRARLYRFDEVDTLSYSTFEDVCRATGGSANGLSGRRIFPLPFERSLIVMPRARATRSSTLSAVSSAETNLLAASAPA